MTVEQLENGAERFVTAGGVAITRQRHDVPYAGAIEAYVDGLNSRRGAVFSSNYEYPGRYTRWDTAIIDPPLVISARGRAMRIEALNARGEALLPVIARAVAGRDRRHASTETTQAPARPEGRRAGPRLHRRGALARAVGVHGAARHHRAVPHRRGCRISASTAPSATISPSSSTRSSYRLERKPRASATSCSICPTRSWSSTTIRPRPGPTATTIRGDGFSTDGPAARQRRRAVQAIRPHPAARRPRAGRICRAGRARRWRVSGAATCSRSCPGQMFYERCETQPSEISPAAEGHQPVALFLLHQSRRGRISDRRLAGNVRAGQWPPRRDLPDLRHDQARRRRDLGLRADPEAAQFQEGRVRADHVLGRRPQRQEPRLRAGLGAGHRPPPDRDVFAADPHGRPYRGPAARRHGRVRRVPVATPGRSPSPARRSCGRCASSRRTRRARAPGMAARSAWCISTAT